METNLLCVLEKIKNQVDYLKDKDKIRPLIHFDIISLINEAIENLETDLLCILEKIKRQFDFLKELDEIKPLVYFDIISLINEAKTKIA
jgi:hypothetical protein